MSDVFEKLSDLVGAAEAKRMLEPGDRMQGADRGISPAQLREKVATLTLEVRDTSDRLDEAIDALKLRVGAMEHRLNLTYAPLLEKVEALELSIGTAHNEAASDRAIMLSLEKRFEVAATALNCRLDAALKRIDELEKLVTAWRGTQKYEPTPEEDARRQRALEHIDAVNERIAAQKAAKP